jgi:KaiC/GvpD/RAD55 family RecA-like ATPase
MIEGKDIIIGETHLEKSPIGITGFDDITDGELPKGRTTLV